jgi:hypothetical protein
LFAETGLDGCEDLKFFKVGVELTVRLGDLVASGIGDVNGGLAWMGWVDESGGG